MLHFCVSGAFQPIDHYVPVARAAEAAGFRYCAVSDHIAHPEVINSPYPYTPDGGLRWESFTNWPDPMVTVGAMAAATETIRFVTGIYILPARRLFTVAKSVGTAAAISGGRLTLGIGVGWMKEEFELLGEDFHTRGKRTDEMLEVLQKLWAGGWVEHHGRFYDFGRLELTPAPGRVPVLVGGLSEAAMRRTARLGDGWISDLHSTEELRGIVKHLRELRADTERADDPLYIFAAATDAFDLDGYRRLEDAGVTHVMTKPWAFHGVEETDLAGKLESLTRFRDEILLELA
jgi:probable F420-dependent oxidoreductase